MKASNCARCNVAGTVRRIFVMTVVSDRFSGYSVGAMSSDTPIREVEYEAGLRVPAGHDPDCAVVVEVAVVGDVPDCVSDPAGGHDIVAHGRIQEQGDQRECAETEQPRVLQCQDAGSS
jgi:hypothetical protein